MTTVTTEEAVWPGTTGDLVTSVNGQTGIVVLDADDVGADPDGAAAAVAAASIPLTQKAAANGVASLDSNGDIPADQLGNIPGISADLLTRFVLGGGEVVATRPGNAASSTFSSGSSNWITNVQSAHTMIRAASTIRLLYRNGHHETDNTNALTVKAQVSLGASGAGPFIPVKFRGSSSVTLEAGGEILSDPVPVDLAAGAQFFVHTWQQAGTSQAGEKYVVNFQSFLTGEFGNNTTADQTGTQLSTGSIGGLIPSLIVAGQPASTAKAMFGLYGDSRIEGKHDTNQEGWAARAVKGTYGYVPAGLSSETMQSFISIANSYKRRQITDGITAAVCDYPINDIAGGRTLAQLQADRTTLIAIMRRAGAHAITFATALPLTTSTDSWVTAGNQTPFAQEAVRTAWNDDLRANAGTEFEFLFDAANVVEVNSSGSVVQNGGRWGFPYASAPAGGGGGADGVHPTIAGHLALATAFQAFLVSNPSALGI